MAGFVSTVHVWPRSAVPAISRLASLNWLRPPSAKPSSRASPFVGGGSVLSDLAMLGIQRRDVEQVVHYGSMAVELAKQTGSSGYIGRKLDGLQLELRPLLSDARIASLNEQIASISR